MQANTTLECGIACACSACLPPGYNTHLQGEQRSLRKPEGVPGKQGPLLPLLHDSQVLRSQPAGLWCETVPEAHLAGAQQLCACQEHASLTVWAQSQLSEPGVHARLRQQLSESACAAKRVPRDSSDPASP